MYWIIYFALCMIGVLICRLDLPSLWFAFAIGAVFAAIDINSEVRTRKRILNQLRKEIQELKESCVEIQD